MTETLNYHSYQNILVVDEYKSIKENELPCNTQEDIQNADYIQNDLSNSASTLKCANSMNLNTNSSEPISFKNPIHVAPFFVAEKNGSDPKLTIREEVLRRNNLYGNNLYTFNSYMEERLIRWRPSLSQNNVDDTVNGKHIYFSMEDQTQNDQSDNGLINLCKRLLETYGIIDTISQPNQMTANVENEMQNENTIPPQEGSNSSEDKDADPGSVIHEDFACFDAQEISLQYEHGQSIKENIRKGKLLFLNCVCIRYAY